VLDESFESLGMPSRNCFDLLVNTIVALACDRIVGPAPADEASFAHCLGSQVVTTIAFDNSSLRWLEINT
jgi:hypothetical protein